MLLSTPTFLNSYTAAARPNSSAAAHRMAGAEKLPERVGTAFEDHFAFARSGLRLHGSSPSSPSTPTIFRAAYFRQVGAKRGTIAIPFRISIRIVDPDSGGSASRE